MKISVIGANGQLGEDVVKVFIDRGDRVMPLTHADLEIVDRPAVFTALENNQPDLIINVAAMHNVEECENNPERSLAVNGVGLRNLSLAANHVDAPLMHVSTDYVFDGQKGAPYLETDRPRPLNVYGVSKLCGEIFVETTARKFFILRVSGLYGRAPCRAKGGRNFVTTMLRLAKEKPEVRVVADEVLAPTYTLDVARQMAVLADTQAYGLYHCVSQGSCSWYDFAGEIFRLTGATVRLAKAGADEFPAKVPRPKYSVLENRALKDAGLDVMPHWTDGLRRYLESTVG